MDDVLTTIRAWAPGLAGLVLVGTAIHEWIYHEHHRYAPGPSNVLALGFLACAVVAFVVMLIARDMARHESRTWAHLTYDEHQKLAEMYLGWLKDDPS